MCFCLFLFGTEYTFSSQNPKKYCICKMKGSETPTNLFQGPDVQTSLEMQLARRVAKRTRVASACIQCKFSRTKCSDTRPCTRCIRSGIGNCGDDKVRGITYEFDKCQRSMPSVAYQRIQSSGIDKNTDFSLSKHTMASMPSMPRCDFSVSMDPFAVSTSTCPDALPLCWWQPW